MSKIVESDCGNITILAGDEIPDAVIVTETAMAKINEILKEEDEGSFLRVGVAGGGCSGFQYMFGIHNELEDDDIINEWDGGKLVVDSTSIIYMKGATVDFVNDFGGEHFAIDNPESSSECGCGSSFAMDM